MSRTYREFGDLLSAYNEADEKWTPIQKAHELLDSVNENEIWEQRHAAANALFTYIAELEAENNRLAELLHNELSSVEIATDLGNKRWVALNDIYENGEKHNTNWCKRKAQEGLGIK